jgi:hypothetical protein
MSKEEEEECEWQGKEEKKMRRRRRRRGVSVVGEALVSGVCFHRRLKGTFLVLGGMTTR